jgi:hypothetical protein
MENEQRQDDMTTLLETYFNNELQDVVKIEDIARDTVHMLLTEGTVYPIPKYDIDEVVRRDFVFEGQETPEQIAELQQIGAKLLGGVYVAPDGEPVTFEKQDSVFEGGKVEFAPFKDVFIPDDVDDWEKAPVIRKVYPTYAELMRDKDKDGYMNIGSWLLKEETEKKLSQDQQSPAQELEGAKVSGKEVIECIECSVTYIYQKEDDEKEDITDFTEERLVVQIALDKKIIIRLMLLRDVNFKNEHLVKRIRLFGRKGLSYGTSLYGKMKSIQKGASKTFNMAINIAEVVMIPWFLYTAKVGFKGDVKLKPGMGVPVDSVEGLYFPRFNINPSQMLEYINLWVSFWERLINISNPQLGRTGDQKKTATEILTVVEEGNITHNYRSTTIKEDFLSLLRTIYDLYYQNMPIEKTFLYNQEEVPIPRVQMARPYKFRLTGSTEMSNKVIERKEKEDLFTLTTQDPAGVFNPIPIREDLLKSWGITETERYINPTIAQIVQLIQEVPQAAELFQQAVQQAMVLAQQVEEGGKQAAAGAMQ